MYFIPQNGLAYFWRAKHKQQIVFYLSFYVPWSQHAIVFLADMTYKIFVFATTTLLVFMASSSNLKTSWNHEVKKIFLRYRSRLRLLLCFVFCFENLTTQKKVLK